LLPHAFCIGRRNGLLSGIFYQGRVNSGLRVKLLFTARSGFTAGRMPAADQPVALDSQSRLRKLSVGSVISDIGKIFLNVTPTSEPLFQTTFAS